MTYRLSLRGAKLGLASATLLLLCASASPGTALQAQVIRVLKPVVKPKGFRPNSLMGDTTISVSVSPSSVSVPLTAGGTGQANNPISITSTLTDPLNTSVNIYGYFVSATAALTGSALGVTIPTSAVFGIVPTGLPSSYTSFTQTSPFGGSGASLQLVALTGLTTNHSQTDNLTLRINLSGIPLPADTYIGTLYIQSQAF